MNCINKNDCNFKYDYNGNLILITPSFIVINYNDNLIKISEYERVFESNNVYVIELKFKEKYMYVNLNHYELVIFTINHYDNINFEIIHNNLYLSREWSNESCSLYDARNKYVNAFLSLSDHDSILLNNLSIN